MLVAQIAKAPAPEMPKDFKGIPILEVQWKMGQGDTNAMVDYAWILYRGEGISRDVKGAMKYFRRAAEKGNAEAKFQLGLFYYVGDGVPVDRLIARRWVDEAARQDHPFAQYVLGTYYENGIGIPGQGPQPAIALEWYRRSAALGCGPAMGKLARFSLGKAGGASDRTQAYVWFRMAQELQGGDLGEEFLNLGQSLTPSERQAAESRLKELRARYKLKP